MGHKPDPKARPELLDLGGDQGPRPAAGGHQDTGVVDGTAPAGPAEKGEGLVEEHLGLEASETRVILDETLAAEAQDEPGALGGERCPTDLQAMG